MTKPFDAVLAGGRNVIRDQCGDGIERAAFTDLIDRLAAAHAAEKEAAERDARRLDWLLRNGKEIVFFVGGDLYCYTHMDDDERGECRVAIDAAIATTEQADE